MLSRNTQILVRSTEKNRKNFEKTPTKDVKVILSKEKILGLVQCDFVNVNVQHSKDSDESQSIWAVLKMKCYRCSLKDFPQLNERWLYSGFSRIFKVLITMNGLNLVHMDG